MKEQNKIPGKIPNDMEVSNLLNAHKNAHKSGDEQRNCIRTSVKN